MIPEGDGKREAKEIDPAQVAKLLEIELMQKRGAWQQAKARRANLRALSFLFLFIVVVGALIGFYLFFSPERVSEIRAGNQKSASPQAVQR